jgi:hypothetical protein
MEDTMKKLILAAITILGVGVGVANAEALSNPAPAQTKAMSNPNTVFVPGSDGA